MTAVISAFLIGAASFAQIVALWLWDAEKSSWTPFARIGAPQATHFEWLQTSLSGDLLYVIGTSKAPEGTLRWSATMLDLGRGAWQPLGEIPFSPPATAPELRWLSQELYLVGNGEHGGAVFTPAAKSWRALEPSGLPFLEKRFVSVAQEKLLVWGAKQAQAVDSFGAIYDPSRRTWNPLAPILTPIPSRVAIAVWTGERQLFWGASSEFGCLSSGAFYSPSTNSWESVASLNAPPNCLSPLTAWVDGRLVVWGGQVQRAAHDFQWTAEGGVYDPLSQSWKRLTSEGAPLIDGERNNRYRASWFGAKLLIFEPQCTGYVFDLTTNRWQSASPARRASAERRYAFDRLGGSLTLSEFSFDAATDSLGPCRVLPLPQVDTRSVTNESLLEVNNRLLLVWLE